MSNSYNTDGMLTFPNDNGHIKNALESIQTTIAFDVSDWSEDRRKAWIYAIVFGWDWDSEETCEYFYKKFKWDQEDRGRAIVLHKQWLKAKELLSKELVK